MSDLSELNIVYFFVFAESKKAHGTNLEAIRKTLLPSAKKLYILQKI